jgi:hypothetical protein
VPSPSPRLPQSRAARGLVLLVPLAAAAGFALCSLRQEPASPTPRLVHAVATGAASVGVIPERRRLPDAPRGDALEPTAPLANGTDTRARSAETIVYLAETSDDPHVISAALREVLTTYSSRSKLKPAPDAALERVLLKHVRSGDPTVAAAALVAARVPLMTERPSEALVNAIVESTTPDSGSSRRYAAFEALDLLRPDRRTPAVLDAFEQALSSPEPYLVSRALLAFSQSGPALLLLPEADRARLGTRVLALGTHPDPGVRGRALAVLSELDWLVPARVRLATALERLGDAHPYVRAEAAELARRCREPLSIHALIQLVSDLAPARYELAGFSLLDGGAGSSVHLLPGRPTVAEAALLAVLSLSQEAPGVTPLTLTLSGRQAPTSLVLQNAELARAWYQNEASRLPRDPLRSTP